ncbi:MAG: response regulator transcription factor [Anaeroplasmataceae bacterium]
MENKVYLLEDDEAITEVVTCALEVAGIKVSAFPNIKSFKEGIDKFTPKVALLDVMLPDGSGLDVLRYIKHNYPQTQVIILSALGQEIDKVKGLNLGADDYIAKPFGTMELIARINAALRRTPSTTFDLAGISVNKDTREVFLNGKQIELNNKEFQLLLYFVENPNVVISRERLLEAVWGYDVGETRTIDNHIVRLRKLGINQIETIFGVGYKFVAK